MILLILAACQQQATPRAQADDEPVVIAKRIATVFISPTPNAAQQEATRLASRPTPPPPAAATPTGTPYIGTFLGEAEDFARDLPVINPALFGNVLPVDTPTVNPRTVCEFEADPAFGAGWLSEPEARRGLGCPTEPLMNFDGTVQVFENGVMYFRPTGEIWAIAPGGGDAGRFWYVEQPPAFTQTDFSAPPGLRAPTLGFGAVWNVIGGVREALGYARTDEQGTKVNFQNFAGGMLFQDLNAGQVFVLVGRNTAYGPFA